MENISRDDFGRRVVVTKGRKVPVGTEGIILWFGYYERGYKNSGVDPYQCVQKIGIKDDNGNMHYTYTHNCEFVAGEEDEVVDIYNLKDRYHYED